MKSEFPCLYALIRAAGVNDPPQVKLPEPPPDFEKCIRWWSVHSLTAFIANPGAEHLFIHASDREAFARLGAALGIESPAVEVVEHNPAIEGSTIE